MFGGKFAGNCGSDIFNVCCLFTESTESTAEKTEVTKILKKNSPVLEIQPKFKLSNIQQNDISASIPARTPAKTSARTSARTSAKTPANNPASTTMKIETSQLQSSLQSEPKINFQVNTSESLISETESEETIIPPVFVSKKEIIKIFPHFRRTLPDISKHSIQLTIHI